ncbi:MAG: DUF4097 family beta strand repeat-containing protein [Colwellia sp.]|nr:DUF4097 family beta strand repeat-containing protein [Colwellia sp.]MCW8866375.1 DUF4097 family beta strand repeat-containing protein [Colwellia sp.]MCW9080889.1 DUF4097 family beta strand repeat-containing protein [Colwellia sp.]
MNKVLKNSLVVCGLIGTYSLPVYADIVDTVEQSFSVEDNSQFSLENINGEVVINSWQEASIKVEATIQADNQEQRDRVEVKMKQNGQHVVVETHYQEKSSWGNNQTAQVEYRVWLPSDTKLADIELVNGSLTINDVSGEVSAQVVNGSITASGLTNDTELSSVNGSIKAYYQSFSQHLDDIELETVNGSIKLYLPKNVNARLDLETMHGSIKTDFGLSSQENTFTGHNLRGDIGTGDVKIDMESVNGSIKVLKN